MCKICYSGINYTFFIIRTAFVVGQFIARHFKICENNYGIYYKIKMILDRCLDKPARMGTSNLQAPETQKEIIYEL